MADKSVSHWPITLTNGAAAVVNLFLPLVLVRILSPEQVGRYKVFSLYIILGPGLFMVSGLTNGLYHWAGKYPETQPEVRQSWTLFVGISLALCAVGLLFSRGLAALAGIAPTDLRLFLFTAPFLLASLFLEDLMIARGRVWTGSFYASGFNILRAAAILGAAWLLRSAESVLWAILATSVARAAAGWLLASGAGDLKPIFSAEKSAAALRYAVPVSVAALAGLVLQNMDQMILSARLTPERFAFYAMGCLTIPPLLVLESSVNRVLIPKLSRAFSANDPAEAAALFSEGVSELFYFLLPATLGLVIYAAPIIQILFTDRYLPAADYLRIYALFYLLLALPYDVAARARGDGGWILRASIIIAPVSIAGTWFAAGRWGAMGALAAFLAAQLLLRLYALPYQRRCFDGPYSRFIPFKDMLSQTGFALAAGCAAVFSRGLFHDARAWFLATAPLFTVAYFAATLAGRSRRPRASLGPIGVLELSQTLGLGGLERMVYSLSRLLSEDERFKVLVATYDHPAGGPSLAPRFEESGIPLLQWRKGNGFSPVNVLRLLRIIFSGKAQVIHAHDLGPLIYGGLAKLLSPERVRLVLTLHTLLDIQGRLRYRLYFKVFLRLPDRIIAVSPGVKAGLVAFGIDPRRVEVIPNGVSFSPSPARLRGDDEKRALRRRLRPGLPPALYDDRWILCLARVHPGKGQDVVLEVWKALPKSLRAGLALFFVGQETDPGHGEILRQRIRALPDPGRVVMAGPSDHPEEWIGASDLFISGSLHEGMPLAPLEAAGSGLPTVLSDIEGHRFLKPWARTFDPAKPEEGAAQVAELLASEELRGERAASDDRWSAAQPLRSKWAAAAMAASYAELFRSN